MRVMRIAVLVLVTLALTSCTEVERKAPSLDCEVAEREFFACMDATERTNECLKLIPFGQPEQLTGIWIFGSESNQFFENQTAVPHNYWLDDGPMISLMIEGSSLADLVSGSSDSFVVDVSFVGRRELCDLDNSPYSNTVVDRVVSQRVIEQEEPDLMRQ
jgi:hypothetical protein